MKTLMSFIALVMLVVLPVRSQSIILENVGRSIPERDSLKIIRMADYQKSFYSQIGIVDSARIKLRIFRNQEAYLSYMKLHSKDAVSQLSGGVFDGKSKELCVPLSSSYLQVVYHELSHYFFNKHFSRSPGWLSEGLARYFEYTQIKKNEILHPLSELEVRYIKSMLEMKEIELKKLVAISGCEVARKSLTNDGYIHKVGYGIVYMFIENHPSEFIQLLTNIKRGAESYDAIQATYPGGFAQFESDFNALYR